MQKKVGYVYYGDQYHDLIIPISRYKTGFTIFEGNRLKKAARGIRESIDPYKIRLDVDADSFRVIYEYPDI